MITTEQYFRKPHSPGQKEQARDLIERRNKLRIEWMQTTGRMACPVDPDTGAEISGKGGGDGDGGFRTPGSREGAKNSSHRIIDGKGAGIDDFALNNEFDTWLDNFEIPMPNGDEGGNTKLEEHGLYREHPSVTHSWCHLTTRAPNSGKRTFMP